jgi:mono/diheme cytochrome c family protein
MHRTFGFLAMALVLAGCASLDEYGAAGSDGATHRGQALAQGKCAMCHTIAGVAASPNPRAPAFSEIHKRYGGKRLDWELQAINDVGHYQMPTTRLSESERGSLAAYISGLRSE